MAKKPIKPIKPINQLVYSGSMPEHVTLNAILRYLATLTNVRVWRMNTGAARYGQTKVRFGLPGQADITGIAIISSQWHAPIGIRLEIEVKSSTGRQSREQQVYQGMIEQFGGIYILARSVDDVQHALESRGVL